jgi:hypothetical protein
MTDDLLMTARRDALRTALARLREERAALALCRERGWTFDARVAQSAVEDSEALVEALLNLVRTMRCAECGQRHPTDDGENIEYDNPLEPTGVSLRFVCAACLDHFNTLANNNHEQEQNR